MTHATEHRAAKGPYTDTKPIAFLIDANGYAWAKWEDGTMSMVVSTTANDSPYPMTVYTHLTVLDTFEDEQ